MINRMIIIVCGILLVEVSHADDILKSEPDASVCTWRFNKKAAISFTMDDGFSDAATIAAPMLEHYGWRGTFYIVVQSILEKHKHQTDWKTWKELARRGHEIGSHSWTNRYLKNIRDPSVYLRELVDSKKMITEKVDVVSLTFAYPSCAYDESSKKETLKHYVHDRSGKGTSVYGKKPANSTAVWTSLDAIKDIDNTIKTSAWHVALIHNVGRDIGYRPTSAEDFKTILDHVKEYEADLWIDTYANVALYKKARSTSDLVVLKSTANSMTIQLELEEAWNDEYPMPYLTVRIPLKAKPAEIQVISASTSLAYSGYWQDGFVLADLPPDSTPVTISWTAKMQGYKIRG